MTDRLDELERAEREAEKAYKSVARTGNTRVAALLEGEWGDAQYALYVARRDATRAEIAQLRRQRKP